MSDLLLLLRSNQILAERVQEAWRLLRNAGYAEEDELYNDDDAADSVAAGDDDDEDDDLDSTHPPAGDDDSTKASKKRKFLHFVQTTANAMSI